jgi:hypothetical protein
MPSLAQRRKNRVAHRLRTHDGFAFDGNIRSAHALPECCAHGGFDARGNVGARKRMPEHHGDRQDHSERVGAILSGDVRCCPVDRLVEAFAVGVE